MPLTSLRYTNICNREVRGIKLRHGPAERSDIKATHKAHDINLILVNLSLTAPLYVVHSHDVMNEGGIKVG